MTYKQLLEELKKMNDEQLDLTATLKLWLLNPDEAQFYALNFELLDQETSEDELGCPDVPHPVLAVCVSR